MIAQEFTKCVEAGGPRPLSDRGRAVAGLFGLAPFEARPAAARCAVEVELAPGDVVLVCGASGTGKSTLLAQMEARLRARGEDVLRLEELALEPSVAVVDTFGEPLEKALEWLSRAGLSEARLWLRAPGELSAGEAFRYRLARFMAGEARVLVADEFAAVLDRTTARVVAWQLGRFVRASARRGVGRMALLATSHGDLVEDLSPTVVVRLEEGRCAVERR